MSGRRRGRIPRLAWLVVALVLTVGRSANARPPIVVIVQTGPPDEMIVEALTRIRGELVAAGCDVIDADGQVIGRSGSPPADGQVSGRSGSPPADGQVSGRSGSPPADARDPKRPPAARVEAAASAFEAIAAFEIVHDADHPNAEVWIADRLTGKAVVRRIEVPAQSGRPISTVSVQAVELLRASLLEGLVKMAARMPPEEPPRPIEVVPPPPRAPRAPRFGVELGPAFVNTSLGHPAEWAAVGRLSYRFLDNLAARATFIGVGPGIEVAARAGSAELRQQMLLFEASASAPIGRFQPSLSLGGGVHHLDVQGEPSSGYLGQPGSYWGLAVKAGIGGSLALSRHFTASLDGHAVAVFPSPVVRVGQEDVARLGRPAVVASFTIGAWM